MKLEERQQALDEIAQEVNVCTKCPLYKGRTHAVPGAGPITAEIMFIGEGPGYHEDKQGLPFVGASGNFLEEMLAEINLDRHQVYISNVVKCRPPGNRDPEADEITTCTEAYLYRQIDLINPKLIVTLGRHSMGLFFPNAKITAIHGQVKWQDDRAYLPMFHPAAILRNIGLKPQAIADFKKIPEILAEFETKGKSPKKSGSDGKKQDSGKPQQQDDDKPLKPTQLSLF